MFGVVIMTRKRYEQQLEEYAQIRTQQQATAYERDLLMKQANLATLQGQINPHFLYNTLDCLRGEALREGSESIANISYALSLFFRYSISGRKSIVKLCDELENIEHYVTIQKYRFGDRFDMEFVCRDKDILNEAYLPKLSLQPIVENAISHGFSALSTGGKILITAQRINDNYSITISDNGCGMPPKELAELCAKVYSDERKEPQNSRLSTGLGLWNVNRRIQLYYGKEYGLNIKSCEGLGTTVEIFVSNRPREQAL